MTDTFTLLFSGNVRALPRNPFTTPSPFGRCIGVNVGDLFTEVDRMREALEMIVNESVDCYAVETAERALSDKSTKIRDDASGHE